MWLYFCNEDEIIKNIILQVSLCVMYMGVYTTKLYLFSSYNKVCCEKNIYLYLKCFSVKNGSIQISNLK